MAVICAVMDIRNKLFCLLGSLPSFFIFYHVSKECKVFIEKWRWSMYHGCINERRCCELCMVGMRGG